MAIPALGFVVPDLIGGHLLMTGDNLQQNYPLHVLVGATLRHGQLPFWNQYIFSGSPLLADFNAGAFYPLMGLFVILPDRAAWIATEVILFSAIAIGMYTFLRTLALSTLACLIAGATFAFSGTVLSQVNHVDMTEGFAAIPWMLLAVLHIVRDGRWRWSVFLGIAFATVILGGAPEAMLDEAILVLAYAGISAGIDRGRWWRVLTRGGSAAALALSLSAIQWLPGLSAIATSQRSGLSGGFASIGSYFPSFGFLSLVPYLYGGYGHIGETVYFNHYNLPEIGIYLGILPMIALATLLHPRWPSRLPKRERLTWYCVGLLGVLLALGSNTPLEHLFNALPLYGHQRLQSRNMIDAAVAVCVLFAGWIDRAPEDRRSLVRYERSVALIPLGVVVGLMTWAMFDPNSLLSNLAHVSPYPSFVRTVRVAAVMASALCATAALIVWSRTWLTAHRWVLAVTIFASADLGVMALTSQLASTTPNAILAGTTPVEQLVSANLAPGGRFAVYDPRGYTTFGRNPSGTPDLNILARLPSVAGYASIGNGQYLVQTQTHNMGELDLPQLARGTFDRLDLQDIVTVPEYFLVPLGNIPANVSAVQRVTADPGDDAVLPLGFGPDFIDPFYPFYPGDRPPLHSGGTSAWFFGESLNPGSATLVFDAPTASTAQIRFGKLRSDGATNWGPLIRIGGGVTKVSGALPDGMSVGLSLQVASGGVPAYQPIVSVAQHAYAIDGPLSDALRPAVWQPRGTAEGYALFVRRRPPRPIFAVSDNGRPGPPVVVLSSTAKSETVKVHAASPSRIVRAVAWDPGWEGSVSVDGGAPQQVPVMDHALVQQVHIPTGRDVVTFSYRPPHLMAASFLSAGAALVLLALLAGTVTRRRLRKKSGSGDQQ
ncbi:MAG TPA: hypothetical protein VND70_01365 [Acidimicrobiales bacterium]|nr:hypothetical protein [Acidimicrobiales bacterium]